MSLLVAIGGPTASGKTKLAIALAQHYGTVILNADSRQFYQEMRIGNARPDAAELAAAQHYFIADRSVVEPLTAGTYAEEALGLLATLFEQLPVVIVVGGSGLYLEALCEGFNTFPEVNEATKTQVQELWEREGLMGLQRELQLADPIYFAEVDQQNARRLQRALEVSWAAGRPYSSFRTEKAPRSFQVVYLQPALPGNGDRAALYDKINLRVDHMLAEGLEAEARALLPHRHLPALQTVGYQEFWPYFNGEYDLDRAVELIKRNSRRYAKRQITWFGRGGRYQSVLTPAAAVALVEAARTD